MKLICIFAALFLCLAFSAFGQLPVGNQTPAQQVSPPGSSDERYRIGYQDTLEIQVFRHPELNRRSPVNPDGTINLFRLDQPITAVCKTETELAADIAKAYEKDYLRNPEVSVSAVERKSQSLAIIGAVKKPGNFYVDRRVQLLSLLAYAEGPDVERVGTRVTVFRPGSTSNCKMGQAVADANTPQLYYFNLREIQEGKTLFWMEPGDVVNVAVADQVYIYGNVNKQGAVDMKEPLTLTRAIVLAGGLKTATEMDNIRVVRQKPGSTEPTEIVYNFKEISKGKSPDPLLEANDIVAISQDKTQSIINSIGRSLTGGLPSIFYRIP
jgi:polysaccharide export outer membrane protein